MRVITLDQRNFTDACRRLENLVASSGFEPDLVVGIATGGEEVSRLMFKQINHVAVTCQRKSTQVKNGNKRLFKLLRHLPRPVLDRMRIAEATLLRHSNSKPVHPQITNPVIIESARRILIVDDAIDSGVTMQAVINAIAAINPTAEIRTAVITVTTPHPVVRPDHALFDNRTLIRFPWSMDNK